MVGMTSTARTPPSKVFTFSSHGMTAMVARKSSTRNRRRLRCVYKMRGPFKVRCFGVPTKCNLQQIWRFPSFETQPVGIPKFATFLHTTRFIEFLSKYLLPNLKERAFWGEPFHLLLQPTKTLGFSQHWRAWLPWLLRVFRPQTSRAQKVAATNNFQSIKANMPPVGTWRMGSQDLFQWFITINLVFVPLSGSGCFTTPSK